MAGMATGLSVVAAVPLLGNGLLVGGMMALCGAGFGTFSAPNNRTMLGSAPKARAGSAGGMQATARLLGTTLGTTVVGLCFQLSGADGARTALLMAIGFALAAGVLSLVRSRVG